MVDPDKIFGRLGNRLFQMATLYAFAKENNTDFYFQNPKWFEKYEKEIKELFSEGIGYLPYVAIHVRRGDYVNNPFYCQLWETGYYIDAINLFPNRKFIVFSDDVEFVKKYFEGDKFAFDESSNEIDALNKMASCSDFIIANSSFSYWAAWLSPSVNKKVVAPTYDKWYSSGNTTQTVLPKNWIQI